MKVRGGGGGKAEVEVEMEKTKMVDDLMNDFENSDDDEQAPTTRTHGADAGEAWRRSDQINFTSFL